MIKTITGASGVGKSYISEYLKTLNNNVVHLNIDLVGHKVLENEVVKESLIKCFDLQLNNNNVDRKILGDLVFNNQEKMKELSNITWSYMEKIIDEFIVENKENIIILDWILIPKTKYFKLSDLNILVTSPFEIRMDRALKRDNITTCKFLEREKATLDFSNFDFDYIINNESLNDTKRKVKNIYDKSIISR